MCVFSVRLRVRSYTRHERTIHRVSSNRSYRQVFFCELRLVGIEVYKATSSLTTGRPLKPTNYALRSLEVLGSVFSSTVDVPVYSVQRCIDSTTVLVQHGG